MIIVLRKGEQIKGLPSQDLTYNYGTATTISKKDYQPHSRRMLTNWAKPGGDNAWPKRR